MRQKKNTQARTNMKTVTQILGFHRYHSRARPSTVAFPNRQLSCQQAQGPKTRSSACGFCKFENVLWHRFVIFHLFYFNFANSFPSLCTLGTSSQCRTWELSNVCLREPWSKCHLCPMRRASVWLEHIHLSPSPEPEDAFLLKWRIFPHHYLPKSCFPDVVSASNTWVTSPSKANTKHLRTQIESQGADYGIQ